MLDKAAILVYNIPVDEIVTCGSGGTGRRARLRGVWFTPYGFKSRFSHQQKEVGNRLPLFVGVLIMGIEERLQIYVEETI